MTCGVLESLVLVFEKAKLREWPGRSTSLMGAQCGQFNEHLCRSALAHEKCLLHFKLPYGLHTPVRSNRNFLIRTSTNRRQKIADLIDGLAEKLAVLTWIRALRCDSPKKTLSLFTAKRQLVYLIKKKTFSNRNIRAHTNEYIQINTFMQIIDFLRLA